MSNEQSSAKNVMIRSRSWALKAARKAASSSTVTPLVSGICSPFDLSRLHLSLAVRRGREVAVVDDDDEHPVPVRLRVHLVAPIDVVQLRVGVEDDRALVRVPEPPFVGVPLVDADQLPRLEVDRPRLVRPEARRRGVDVAALRVLDDEPG